MTTLEMTATNKDAVEGLWSETGRLSVEALPQFTIRHGFQIDPDFHAHVVLDHTFEQECFHRHVVPLNEPPVTRMYVATRLSVTHGFSSLDLFEQIGQERATLTFGQVHALLSRQFRCRAGTFQSDDGQRSVCFVRTRTSVIMLVVYYRKEEDKWHIDAKRLNGHNQVEPGTLILFKDQNQMPSTRMIRSIRELGDVT